MIIKHGVKLLAVVFRTSLCSVNDERIREVVTNSRDGSWFTYLTIGLCFLEPQLSWLFVLKAFDKPPVRSPLGTDDAVVMATLRQHTSLSAFGPVMSFRGWRQAGATVGHNHETRSSYQDVHGHGWRTWAWWVGWTTPK